MNRNQLLEVFEENSCIHPSLAIYVWLDSVAKEFHYFSGDFCGGIRGTDHRALWCHFDDDTQMKDILQNYHIMVISPEREHLLMDENDYGIFKDIINENFENYEIEYVEGE